MGILPADLYKLTPRQLEFLYEGHKVKEMKRAHHTRLTMVAPRLKKIPGIKEIAGIKDKQQEKTVSLEEKRKELSALREMFSEGVAET